MIPGQVIDWLNENEFRAYPLAERGTRIVPGTSVSLDRFILDASIVTSSATPVKFESLEKGASFKINLTGQTQFVFPLTGPFPLYLRNANGSLLVVGEAITQLPNGLFTFTDVYFEPSVITEFYGPWLGVSKITVANNPEVNLIGNITLLEGKQVDIKLSPGIIRLAAGSSYGLPVTCDDIPPEDSACSDIVSYINGATPLQNPGNIMLIAGSNVRIYDDPANHRIYVGLSFEHEDVCTPVALIPKAVVT